MTPFKAVYGREPPSFHKLQNGASAIQEVNEQVQARNSVISTLKDNLIKAQEEMRRQANKHRRDIQIEVGEHVYVRIQPYRLKTLAKRINEKLSPRYYGPFKVLERIGAVSYKLDLLPTTRVRPVFHVSALKKSVQSAMVQPTIPTALTEQLELQVQP